MSLNSLLTTTSLMSAAELTRLFSVTFSIYSDINEKSYKGILIASTAENSGTVCRENTESPTITPSLESAHILCRLVTNSGTKFFHKANWVDRVGYTFNWARDLPIFVRDVVCNGTTNSCNMISADGICKVDPSSSIFYTTTLSCDCNEGHYRTGEGCVQCGLNTYTQDNNTSCTPCPDGTSSRGKHSPSAPEDCVRICSPGQVMISNSCVKNTTLAAVVCSVVVVISLMFVLRYSYRKYQDLVRRKRQQKRAKARGKCSQEQCSKDWSSDPSKPMSSNVSRPNILVL